MQGLRDIFRRRAFSSQGGITIERASPMAKDKGNKGNKGSGTPYVPPVVSGISLPAGAKVKRHITLPSLAIKNAGQQENLFICDAMRVSKITSKADAQKPREPATICTAVKIDTGETVTFIVPAVVKANLERDYCEKDSKGEVTAHNYVGKAFAIKNNGKRTESQRYNDFSIYELELSEEDSAKFSGVSGGAQ